MGSAQNCALRPILSFNHSALSAGGGNLRALERKFIWKVFTMLRRRLLFLLSYCSHTVTSFDCNCTIVWHLDGHQVHVLWTELGMLPLLFLSEKCISESLRAKLKKQRTSPVQYR